MNRALSHSLSTSAIKDPRVDINCFTLPDSSDSDGQHSPLRPLPNFTNSIMSKLIKPEPHKDSVQMTDVSRLSNQMTSTSQKKRLLAKAQQQAHLQNQKQIPQIRVDSFSVAKQEISCEEEDLLTTRLNYMNAQNYHNNSSSRRYESQSGQYMRSAKLENLEGEKLIKCAVSPNRVSHSQTPLSQKPWTSSASVSLLNGCRVTDRRWTSILILNSTYLAMNALTDSINNRNSVRLASCVTEDQ